MNKRIFAAVAVLFASSALYNWTVDAGWNPGTRLTLAHIQPPAAGGPDARPLAETRFETVVFQGK